MSCSLKTLALIFCLSFGTALPETFAQQDSTAGTYKEYEDEDFVTDDERDAAEAAETPPVRFSEISAPLPFKDRAITTRQWQALTQDPAFAYEDEKPRVKEEDTGSGLLKVLESIVSFFSSAAGKALIWIVVASLVLLIIFRIFKLNGNVLFARKDKKIGNGQQDESADDYIPDDWEQSIAEAAKAGNYRLAVRHGYRYLLSLLSEKELIRFQTAKTNYQYTYELSGTQWHQPFVQLTRQYEYAWYGGFDIKQEQFEAYYRLLSETRKGLK
jgi:hypothetical protein